MAVHENYYKKQPTSSTHSEAITLQFCLYTISPIGKNLSVVVRSR